MKTPESILLALAMLACLWAIMQAAYAAGRKEALKEISEAMEEVMENDNDAT